MRQSINNYWTIIQALENEVSENSINSAEANGLYAAIFQNTFIVHLHVFHEILSLVHILSQQFQNTKMTIGKASSTINVVLTTLEKRRSDNHFDSLREKISKFADDLDISLQPNRGSKK